MTVFKRGDGWAVKVWEGGRWRWVGTFERQRDAKAAEAEAKRRRPSARMTVDEFCTLWLRDYARQEVSTQRTYDYAIRAFRDEYGRRQLGSFDRPEARAWAVSAPRHQLHAVRAMYADAMRDGLIPDNPFADLRLPRSRGRKNIVALTEPQVASLADAAFEVYPDSPFAAIMRALVLTAGLTGMREGELCAWRWVDVGLHDGRADVLWALSRGGLKRPKSGKPRTIVLPPPVVDALSNLPRLEDVETVFYSPHGRPFTSGSLSYHWRSVRAAGGHPTLAFHELRHAAATIMLERGVSPYDVAVQLGHSDGGRLVMELYGHPSEEAARGRIDRAWAPRTGRIAVARERRSA